MPSTSDDQQFTETHQSSMFNPGLLSNERVSYVDGLLAELEKQTHRYLDLVSEEQELQAKITICERNLQTTRDFIQSQLENTVEAVPMGWKDHLNTVRFVGMRIGDACVRVLKESAETDSERGLSTEGILHLLNDGQFRFRTGYPLREIHAALVRNNRVEREGDLWRLSTGDKQSERRRHRKAA